MWIAPVALATMTSIARAARPAARSSRAPTMVVSVVCGAPDGHQVDSAVWTVNNVRTSPVSMPSGTASKWNLNTCALGVVVKRSLVRTAILAVRTPAAIRCLEHVYHRDNVAVFHADATTNAMLKTLGRASIPTSTARSERDALGFPTTCAPVVRGATT